MVRKLIFLFILATLAGCECDEHLSLRNKDWMAGDFQRSSLAFASGNGLSDVFTISATTRQEEPYSDRSNGGCELTAEYRNIRYVPVLNIATFEFSLTNTELDELCEVSVYGYFNGRNEHLKFAFSMGFPEQFTRFSYYPYALKVKGLVHLPDSTINQVRYNRLYALTIDSAGLISPFSVCKILIDLQAGLVSYTGKNGVTWTRAE